MRQLGGESDTDIERKRMQMHPVIQLYYCSLNGICQQQRACERMFACVCVYLCACGENGKSFLRLSEDMTMSAAATQKIDAF